MNTWEAKWKLSEFIWDDRRLGAYGILHTGVYSWSGA